MGQTDRQDEPRERPEGGVLTLRCYVCGLKVRRFFYLVSAGDATMGDVDRVFIMGGCCVTRADDVRILEVESLKERT